MDTDFPEEAVEEVAAVFAAVEPAPLPMVVVAPTLAAPMGLNRLVVPRIFAVDPWM
jgi:hypothetical protein